MITGLWCCFSEIQLHAAPGGMAGHYKNRCLFSQRAAGAGGVQGAAASSSVIQRPVLGACGPCARKRGRRRSCPTDLLLAALTGNEETYHRLLIRVIILALYSDQVTQVTITDLTIITL